MRRLADAGAGGNATPGHTPFSGGLAMTFRSAILICFRKYLVFSGRAARSEYWNFVLFLVLAAILAAVLDYVLFGAGELVRTDTGFSAASNGPVSVLFALATVIPGIAAGWRRMHDTGRSGLFLFYPLIVMVGILGFVSVFGDTTTLSAVVVSVALFVAAISPLIVIWWLTRPSEPGENAYGPNPHEVAS